MKVESLTQISDANETPVEVTDPQEIARLDQWEKEHAPFTYSGATVVMNDGTSYEVDSLDDMQPIPRAGKFFAELVVRGEIQREKVWLPEEDEDALEASALPRRARVIQLGQPREGEAWDFEVGWDVILPYHAGHHFRWFNQAGIEEHVWIIDTNEVIAIFRPRSLKAQHLCDVHRDLVRAGFSPGQKVPCCEDPNCEFSTP